MASHIPQHVATRDIRSAHMCASSHAHSTCLQHKGSSMDCVRICSTDFAFPKSNPTFPVKPWLTPALEKAASWHHTLTIPHSISSQQMQRAGRCLSYISTMHLCSSFRSQQSLASMKVPAGMPPRLLPEGGGMQHETCWSCSLKSSSGLPV
jgi:hypothetical protein